MKLRVGFVSNSSSSNFIVFGVKISTSEAEKLAKDLNVDLGKYNDPYDYGYDLAKKLDVSFYPSEEFGFLLGTVFKDTATAIELSELNSVKKKLKSIDKEAKLYIRCFNE